PLRHPEDSPSQALRQEGSDEKRTNAAGATGPLTQLRIARACRSSLPLLPFLLSSPQGIGCCFCLSFCLSFVAKRRNLLVARFITAPPYLLLCPSMHRSYHAPWQNEPRRPV